MYIFKNKSLQVLPNNERQIRERLFGGKALYIFMALAAATLLFIGTSVSYAQDLFVSSSQTDEILRYDGETGEFIEAFVTEGSGGLDDPTALVLGPDNNLYVLSRQTNEVLRYDGDTGAFIDVFVTAGRAGGFLSKRAQQPTNSAASHYSVHRCVRHGGERGTE